LTFAAQLLGWFEVFCFVQAHLSRSRRPLRCKFGQTPEVLYRGLQRELIGRATNSTDLRAGTNTAIAQVVTASGAAKPRCVLFCLPTVAPII